MKTSRSFLLFLGLMIFTSLAVIPKADAQVYPLVGTWQTRYQQLTFKADGSFSASAVATYNQFPGQLDWNGSYKVVEPTAWSARIDATKFCAVAGGCASCPPDGNDVPNVDGCEIARSHGVVRGVDLKRTFQPNGDNQFGDDYGNVWQRAGTGAPVGGEASPMQPCVNEGELACPAPGWQLRCERGFWITGPVRC